MDQKSCICDDITFPPHILLTYLSFQLFPARVATAVFTKDALADPFHLSNSTKVGPPWLDYTFIDTNIHEEKNN